MAVRRYLEADLKRLFALSHNVCAYPSCDQRIADVRWDSVQGEVCHLYGLNLGSARYDPGFPSERLNAFENLIVMCPNHHRVIDKLESERWPADALIELKARHESQRSGDVPMSAEMTEKAVLALIVMDGLEVEGLGNLLPAEDDSGVEVIDPATGVQMMASAIAQASQIEARNFGRATPFDLKRGWVEIGLAAGDHFDLLVARSIEAEIPSDDVLALRRLRDEANGAFGRIPGC